MTTVLLVGLGVLLQGIGLVGCVLPVLPGPPLNWLGLFFYSWAHGFEPFGVRFLVAWGAVAAAVTALDFVVPAWGARKAGATGWGVWGSVAGMIAGILWFPPFGMLLGALAGAIAGELVSGRTAGASFKAGFGVFMGTTFGIVLKVAASGVMAYYFFAALTTGS